MSSHSCGYLNSKLRGQSGDSGISTGSHESDDENKIVTERSHDAHEDGQPNRTADVSIINEDPEDSSTDSPYIQQKDRYPTRQTHVSTSHETQLMLVRALVKSMHGPEKAFDEMDTNGDNKVTTQILPHRMISTYGDVEFILHPSKLHRIHCMQECLGFLL